MKVKKFIEENGIDVYCDKLKKWSCVDVGFINDKGKEDETQFDIEDIDTFNGKMCLAELFSEFCEENNFPKDTVTYVLINVSADTYEELLKIS